MCVLYFDKKLYLKKILPPNKKSSPFFQVLLKYFLVNIQKVSEIHVVGGNSIFSMIP